MFANRILLATSFKKFHFKGLANLFQGELSKLSQQHKNDSEHMRLLFHSYLVELGAEANRVLDWNGGAESQKAALIICFASFAKRYSLPKQIGKVDLEKLPTFVNKKLKLKKASPITCRSHVFVELLETSSRATCLVCIKPFWGIGYQGFVCQSKLIEMIFY